MTIVYQRYVQGPLGTEIRGSDAGAEEVQGADGAPREGGVSSASKSELDVWERTAEERGERS